MVTERAWESEADPCSALESLTQGSFWNVLTNESVEEQEGQHYNEKFLNNNYTTVFRTIISDMTAQSELEDDFGNSLSRLLEGENRRKPGGLFHPIIELNAIIRSLAGQRSKELAGCSFRLSDEPKFKEYEYEMGKQYSTFKMGLELDTEWIQKRTKVHQGDGKLILYPNDRVFHVFFPDGTGQIHYPSGNLAMLIFCTDATTFTYIVLEDRAEVRVRALINNSGHATFYDDNGDIWANSGINLGYYFPKDKHQKAWNWWNLSIHVHAPPIKCISLKINQHIQVEIKSQDKIIFCFFHKKKKIYLNLGTRYKFINTETLDSMKSKAVLEVEPGQAVWKLQVLLGKISRMVKFLTIPDLENFTENAKTLLMKKTSKVHEISSHISEDRSPYCPMPYRAPAERLGKVKSSRAPGKTP
uniref:Glutamate-rich protein 6B n=1 Tax=Castor canadensis TaxID=51338 RepID=A0A8B7TQ89_CASCN|nr:glutamate-rich protein 6B [Castor canadensis]